VIEIFTEVPPTAAATTLLFEFGDVQLLHHSFRSFGIGSLFLAISARTTAISPSSAPLL